MWGDLFFPHIFLRFKNYEYFCTRKQEIILTLNKKRK